MQTVDVFGKYKVYIGSGLLEEISEIIDLSVYSKVVVIADEKIPSNLLSQFEKIIISSGESNKNIETVQLIWKKMIKGGRCSSGGTNYFPCSP